MNTNPEPTQVLEVETESNTELNDDELMAVVGGAALAEYAVILAAASV